MQFDDANIGPLRSHADRPLKRDVAELLGVMEHIQAALRSLPPTLHCYVGNALLNLAVDHMVDDLGTERAATTLIRLVDCIVERGASPPPEEAVDLSISHS